MISTANLYIPGAPKAGTTTVTDWLGQHHDVFVSRPKEPTFLAQEFPEIAASWGCSTWDSYQKLYASAEAQAARYRVDASTFYFYSNSAVDRILEQSDDVRFVVCLRNPADLVVSYHRQQVLSGHEPIADFDEAWAAAVRRVELGSAWDGETNRIRNYPNIGSLGTRLAWIVNALPPDRIHTVVLEELSAAPDRSWESLCSFLEIDPITLARLPQRNVGNRRIRVPWLHRSFASTSAQHNVTLRRARQALQRRDDAFSRSVKFMARRIVYAHAERPSTSSETFSELQAYFSTEVERVQEVLGRRIPSWDGQ